MSFLVFLLACLVLPCLSSTGVLPCLPIGRGSAGDGLPRKGVVQTLSSEGWSWIKKDGTGSRKNGNRIPFKMGDVVTKVSIATS